MMIDGRYSLRVSDPIVQLRVCLKFDRPCLFDLFSFLAKCILLPGLFRLEQAN